MAEKNKAENSQNQSQAAQAQQDLSGAPPKAVNSPVRTAELVNGEIHISGKKTAIKHVDVADVDLLVTLETGEKVIVPNGAIDALTNPSMAASFADGSSSLYDLFKMTGSSHAAKAGSLRIVTENIDANPPEAVNTNTSTNSDIAPPAPLVKTGTGTGNGNGVAKEQPEPPQEFSPPVVATPTVFSAARKSISSEELKNLTGSGTPNISASLYTASEYKITPSGVSDLPGGAYDPQATADQLTERASAQGQSTVDKIYGTSGNDTFDFNSAFSASENQWAKTLHITLNNFSTVSSIEIVFDASKIVDIPGFNLIGEGVTRTSPTSNTWTITPTTAMLTEGLNLNIVYNIASNVTPVNFAADLVVKGKAGILLYDLTKNLLFSWRDASTLDDFNVVNDTGIALAVLPSGGVGNEIFAYEGNDAVYAGAGNDIVNGGDGNDLIVAGTGNDLIEGGAGADTMDGGLGSDTSTYGNASTGIVANLNSSLSISNTGDAAGDTYFSIENLTGSRFNDTLIGNNQNNKLTGGDGDDTLIGGAGADTLVGGAGTDTASYIHSTASVTVDLKNNRGTAGDANGDTLNSIENLVGGQSDDVFISGSGVLANTFDGQAGQDTVSYALSSSNVTSSLTTGFSDVTQTNDAQGDVYINIENLAGSAFNDTLIGNALNNILTGNAGNDTLEGLGGADEFIGGTGLNTVTYAHSALAVIASLSTSFSTGPAVNATNDAVGDTYIDIQNLTGTTFNDTLIGDENKNTLMGSDGDDVLEGMGDADTLDGGLGSDTASYVHATSAIAASLTAGLSGFVALGDAEGDTFTSIENITGSNFNDLLIGDNDANRLEGGAGDDILEGLGGADTLIGGTGNNTATYARAADLGAGLGLTASLTDAMLNTGDAFGDTYTNIQNLIGSAFHDTLTGDANNNILTGGLGNDTLTGDMGADTLNGNEGDDLLIDDLLGVASINGGDGDDIIRMTNADGGVDTISGGAGVDTLEINTPTLNHFWAIDLQPGNNNGGIRFAFGSNNALMNGVENVTLLSPGQLFVYMNNVDNVIRGSATSTEDYVYYDKSIAGINLDFNTGVVTGGSGNDMLFNIDSVDYGSHFNDVLIGNSGNSRLNGGQGADLIDGGAGIDSVWYHQYESAPITVSLMNASINDALGIQFTGMARGDVLVNIEQLFGSVFWDTLYGNSDNNTLWGHAGNDILEGMAGADALDGMGDNDTASYANAGLAAAGSETTAPGQGVVASLTTSFSVGPAVIASGDAAGDTYFNIENLLGSSFDDTLIGNSGVNILTGGAGNDILEGLGGGDTFSGGAGVDTVTYIHSTAGVVADLSGTIANTNDALGDTFTGVENLTGTNFNDSLYGDGNNNTLDGGLGTNFMDGGGGVDTVSYLSATGAVNINLVSNTVSGASRSDTLLNIERAIGSNFADTITGTTGNDWIDGGLGADTLDGDAGSDTISYDSATGGISITLGGANSQSDTLNSFENVFGSAFNDLITGDGSDNTLEGGLGDDTLNGGGGNNTVSYSTASAAVQVNISGSTLIAIAANSATGGAGSDTLSNFTHITGSNHNDTLIGDSSANTLNGGAGNDTLVGGAGGDTLIGGTGADTASYTNASSAIAVTINGTGTLGDANGDTLNGIENIIGSNFDDSITGDSLNNLIEGALGNDTINGGAGNDTASYATAASAVTINLSNAGANVSGGAGNDTLTNIENLIGSAFADNITGDGSNNTIEGGMGNDIMNGGAGVDTVSYINANAGVNVNISGSSVLSVAANSATGGDGSDTLSNFENIIGSAFNDILVGNGSNNSFDGGAGDDTLVGGAGADAFIGGLGIDTVSYVNASSGVNMTLDNSLTQTNDAAGDTFLSIENIIGTAFGDNLFGDNVNNTIIGGQGNDVLAGRDGNDILDLSEGGDTAYGDGGDDTFIVNVANNNTPNYIHGGSDLNSFNLGGDTIRLTGLTSGQNYSLSAIANVTDVCEIVDIRDTINSTLTLGSIDVQRIMDQGNGANLFIKADSGDTLNLSLNTDQTVQTFNVHNGTSYVIFTGSTQVAAVHWQTA